MFGDRGQRMVDGTFYRSDDSIVFEMLRGRWIPWRPIYVSEDPYSVPGGAIQLRRES